MIELYLSISKAISAAPGNRWTDIGPRVADHSVVYPATFVQDIAFNPEEIGAKQYYGEFTFTVVTYIKPYHGSTAKPKSPVLDKLAEAFEPVMAVRQAIYDLQDEYVENTVWLRENITCDRDGMYTVTQYWKGTATVSFAPVLPPKPQPAPKLVMEESIM